MADGEQMAVSGGLSELIEVLKEITDNPMEHNGAIGEMSTTNQLDSPPLQSNQNPNTGAVRKKIKPYIKIVEQPSPKAKKFRYACEGRLAGSLQGVNSTPENRTYPTIEIVGWNGEVNVLASLVTKDEPYKAHPHNLVSKDEHFKDGIFRMTLKAEPYRIVFSNMGIQCVKKKDIKESLDKREELEVDPFKQKFGHKDSPGSIDLNAVRLCFQAYITLPEGGHRRLTPVVSDPIYRNMNELVISRLCGCSAKVSGGDELILLCEKVDRDDVKIRFFEEDEAKNLIWESFGEFTPNNVHKQFAIAFKTPRYYKDEVEKNAKIFIQLMRPSDGATSDPLPFEYFPNPGMRTFSRIRRKLKRKQDLEIFQQILSMDSETTATKYSQPPSDPEQDNDDQYDDDDDDDEHSCSTESSKSNPLSSDTLHDEEDVVAVAKRQQSDSDADDDERSQLGRKVLRYDDVNDADDYISENGMRDPEIELEIPSINYPGADEATQTSTPMDETIKQPELDLEPRGMSTNAKIAEWMRLNEFERIDSLTVENGDDDDDVDGYDNGDILPVTAYTSAASTANRYNDNTNISSDDDDDDDKSLVDMLERVTEVDETQADESRRGTLVDTPALIEEMPNDAIDHESKELENIFAQGTASTQASVDVDENFDETSTYTSLQIAFRNPIDIPLHVLRDPLPLTSKKHSVVENSEGLVVLTNPPAPKIRVNVAQTPPSPPTPTLRLPPRTPSPIPDQMLPPLPPKPLAYLSRDNSYNNVAALQRYSDPGPAGTTGIERIRQDSGRSSPRPQSQIIIMRTPDQSPTKRQTQNATPTSSPKKKQGFFSRLFSRRKSKADCSSAEASEGTATPPPPTASATPSLIGLKGNSMATTPTGSREPSIGNFSLADANRASLRSNRSGALLQPPSSPGISAQNNGGSTDGTSILRGKPVGRSSSSVSGKRPANTSADVIHIPLKDPDYAAVAGGYSSASTITLGQQLDRRTLSALQLAEIPIFDGNMELVAIADRQSIKNLCAGAYGVQLDPSVDLSEAEHFALYTSMPPPCSGSTCDALNSAECDEHISNYLQQVEAGHILTPDEVARRLTEANNLQ